MTKKKYKTIRCRKLPVNFDDRAWPVSDFFFCKRGLHFSQSYGAYFNMTQDIVNIAQTFTVRVCTCTCTYDVLKIRAIWLAEILGDGNPRLQKKKSRPVMIISWKTGTFLCSVYYCTFSETDTNNFTSSKTIPNLTFFKIISFGNW